ncbi:E3 ubiquitin-protein ligase UPL5 isoform X2 [Punica granatum]|uniref:HECT-type E3 ubiquitin transferase n=1 Tax=Punica granatum TaxID=22663 RepID=A0A6P8DSR0_PUNGR|nr:E3 ubiquitin-protein ligase UPL5 isoform X2 [Punica granatum]
MSITDNRAGTTNSADRRRSSSTSSAITSAKRKLDDYASAVPEGDEAADFAADLVTVRMRKEEFEAVHCSAVAAAVAAASSSSWASPSQSSPFRYVRSASPSQLQFFVRMMSEGKTLVIQATCMDTVKSVHEKIHKLTGIPVSEQRLIYRGKQLQWEQSLAQCAIEKDASLQLVGRMRSTEHPQAWQYIDDMISIVRRLCKGEAVPYALKIIKTRISEYLSITPKDDYNTSPGHLQIFMSSSAPLALIMLCISPVKGNKKIGEEAIRHFLYLTKTALPKASHSLCAPIVLKFCKLLREVPQYELLPLYSSCRTCIGSLLETIGLSQTSKNLDSVERVISVEEIFPFVSELADSLYGGLDSNIASTAGLGPLQSDVNDFAMFLPHIRTAIREHLGFRCPIPVPPPEKGCDDPKFVDIIVHLYEIFMGMLRRMDCCLLEMEKHLASKSTSSGESDIFFQGPSQYLAILKELNAISKLYVGSEEHFWTKMRLRKRALCALILKYVKRTDDNQWLLEHKDVTDFEARRHMMMMLFPEVKDDYDEQHEMLIDRSQLLAESFNYVSEADPESLHGNLFMEFKNEEATGPGVVREWFFLVCQAIFNQENALFVACPNDCSRFYPNPASKVDPLHLKYFKFAGRMIALALMHKVQIDALGLTFVREVEELGLKKVIELLPGGANLVVNSKNRSDYVNLLVKHQFVTSISEQVAHFAQGFADIFSSSRTIKVFFRSLELEDLDFMLRGSADDISVQDWKAHTEYNGYKETDPQIVWFWKIVSELTTQQRRELLFFWTSVKHLPVEGFRGLASRLHIYRSLEPIAHLPTSHTCFYRLCFPAYPCLSVMQARLLIITQGHVGSSFGTF